MKTKLLILSVAVLLAPLLTQASVNPKNGNFFITYRDITQQVDSHELSLRRTYNSLTSSSGWFGYGWGSPYETHLTVMPDGTAAILENGSGRISMYRPRQAANVAAAVVQIVAAASARDKLTPEAAQSLGKTLMANEEMRVRKVRQYAIESALPGNALLKSDICNDTRLENAPQGYRRVTCDGGNEYFDRSGRLLRTDDGGDYHVDIRYEGAGPVSIVDSLGQKLLIKWDDHGRVIGASAADEDKTRVTFTYDGRGDLVKASAANGIWYAYEYDANHNMTRIGYLDSSSMKIAYVSEQSGFVSSVTERNGAQSLYEYGADPVDAGHIWTKQTDILISGQRRVQNYDFHVQTNATGIENVAGISRNFGGEKLEKRFDEKGRLVWQRKGAHQREYVYHPHTDKLILAITDQKQTVYRYDDHGKLTQAADSKGQVIDLYYGSTSNSNIDRLVETNTNEALHRELLFKYNENGKPVEINLIGTGRIAVTYDDKGEILQVDSAQGAKMALEVTQIFQDLMSAVNTTSMSF